MKALLRPRLGVTLIELMVVLAVLGVLIAVAAPSVRKLLDVQRLRGVSSQLTTNIQFVRAEAASRQEIAGISFRYILGSQSCYTIHTCGSTPATNTGCVCDCTAAEGSRCPAPSVTQPDPPREIRTITVPATLGVAVGPANTAGGPVSSAWIWFDPSTGGLTSFFAPSISVVPNPSTLEFVGVTRLISPAEAVGAIRTEITATGRPRTCEGLAICP